MEILTEECWWPPKVSAFKNASNCVWSESRTGRTALWSQNPDLNARPLPHLLCWAGNLILLHLGVNRWPCHCSVGFLGQRQKSSFLRAEKATSLPNIVLESLCSWDLIRVTQATSLGPEWGPLSSGNSPFSEQSVSSTLFIQARRGTRLRLSPERQRSPAVRDSKPGTPSKA